MSDIEIKEETMSDYEGQLDKDFVWDNFAEMKAARTVIQGEVAGVVKGGVIMYVDGVRGFIPASKLDLKYVEDTESYLGKVLDVIITEADGESQKLVLSAKELLQEKARAERAMLAQSMQVGSVVKGVVETIKDYGAFVNIGDGLSGLLHVSQITNERIKHPKAVLKEGQEVEVMITKVENGKLSLSMKALKEAAQQEADEEAVEDLDKYNSEYVPNTPFAALIANLKK